MKRRRKEEIEEAKRKERKIKSYIIIGIVAAVALGVTVAVMSNTGSGSAKASGKIGTAMGDTFPVFSFADIDGNRLKLSDLRGKPTYMVFTTSWCIPCQVEGKNMKKVDLETGNNSVNAMIIFVDPREPVSDLRWWKNNFGNDDWFMVYNINAENIALRTNVRSLDTTYVLDKDGIIIYKDEGWVADYPVLKAKITQALTGQVTELTKKEVRLGPLGGIHEHADFKVYLNGTLVDFAQKKYQVRSQFVHVEGMDGDVIHMHATGETVGYFLETLGMRFDRSCFVLDTGESFCSSGDNTLKLYVNGELNAEYGDYLLKDLDKILISYGKGTEEEIRSQLDTITDKARSFSFPTGGVT